MAPNTANVQWTRGYVIDLVRRIRNGLIKDLLDDHALKAYIASNFNARELTGIRLELLRQELRELLIQPVDVAHYKDLIDQIHTTGIASLARGNERLFYEDVEKVVRNYV